MTIVSPRSVLDVSNVRHLNHENDSAWQASICAAAQS